MKLSIQFKVKAQTVKTLAFSEIYRLLFTLKSGTI